MLGKADWCPAASRVMKPSATYRHLTEYRVVLSAAFCSQKYNLRDSILQSRLAVNVAIYPYTNPSKQLG